MVSTTQLQILQYPRISSSNTWSSTPNTITKAFDTDCSFELGNGNDAFGFKIANTNNAEISNYNTEDKINIHLLLNGESVSSSNLLFNGVIRKISEQYSEKSKVLSIEGRSFGEIMLNGVAFKDESNVDFMQHLQSCLDSVKYNNTSFSVIWDSNNPTLKKDGIKIGRAHV